MKVFVAGHRGMVGSALFQNAPAEVDLITAERSEIDITDTFQVSKFLEVNQVDSVILAAAKVGGIGANSIFQKDFLYQNIEIQNSVLMAAANLSIANLIFLGSSCIYPRLSPQPIAETSLLSGPLEPTNEGYALAKIAGIRLAKAIHDEDHLNFFSLMPTNLYGPNDNFDIRTSHVPAALIRKFHEAKIANNPEVVVWGSGSPRREFMHAYDLADACWFLLTKDLGGELINIGTGIDLPISKFAEMIAKVVGFEGKIVYDRSKPDGPPRKLLDVSKIHSLGWRHRISLEDGIKQTYEWFLDALKDGKVRGF